MARRKKKFECNHRGFGKFCHRCHNEKHHPKAVTAPTSQVAVAAATASSMDLREQRRQADRIVCPKCKSSRLQRTNFTELADMSVKEFTCRECEHEFDEHEGAKLSPAAEKPAVPVLAFTASASAKPQAAAKAEAAPAAKGEKAAKAEGAPAEKPAKGEKGEKPPKGEKKEKDGG